MKQCFYIHSIVKLLNVIMFYNLSCLVIFRHHCGLFVMLLLVHLTLMCIQCTILWFPQRRLCLKSRVCGVTIVWKETMIERRTPVSSCIEKTRTCVYLVYINMLLIHNVHEKNIVIIDFLMMLWRYGTTKISKLTKHYKCAIIPLCYE